ncbi:hypothetical protein BC829DRAFT_284399 [Chytridium lagenaria]|nr:hypothetical protein BC829DRAFT_284399 [Chytridium lagenaria]
MSGTAGGLRRVYDADQHSMREGQCSRRETLGMICWLRLTQEIERERERVRGERAVRRARHGDVMAERRRSIAGFARWFEDEALKSRKWEGDGMNGDIDGEIRRSRERVQEDGMGKKSKSRGSLERVGAIRRSNRKLHQEVRKSYPYPTASTPYRLHPNTPPIAQGSAAMPSSSSADIASSPCTKSANLFFPNSWADGADDDGSVLRPTCENQIPRKQHCNRVRLKGFRRCCSFSALQRSIPHFIP